MDLEYEIGTIRLAATSRTTPPTLEITYELGDGPSLYNAPLFTVPLLSHFVLFFFFAPGVY